MAGSKAEPFETYWHSHDGGHRTLCWRWHGASHELGYGRVFRDGKLRPAHRYSYEQKIGAIPDGMVIDHLCRNPWCVNPWHMEPVAQSENVRRGAKAKLDWNKVRAIRGDDRPLEDIAKDYGVSTKCISHVKRNTRWRETA